jgi:hypothetical protein
MSPISQAKIFDLLEKKLFEFIHFSGYFPPLQIRNRPLPKPFPTFPLSRKTTARDFGQKTRGEVGFGFEGVGEATRNGR